ncbi:MAG: KpsF/GutQ family sugar-phosphate isomerase [Rhodobacteraceae bacterium]|nr:KpsF/GutQ family sugar-phosphate isomerase [Paracoccaceae bacterium]
MTDPAFQTTARNVILAEAQALGTLAEALDGGFDAAVSVVLAGTGRLIVTGIGKSGHIARKIAATLASTGTPAQFVHPAEASHGDLGMITKSDVVLAISNSGEAPELANLLTYTRRFDIPLIGMTSRDTSTLATHSDVVLLLPRVEEACGTGVVPTSSTTMSLALGDALAVALMKHRAFTAEHFREFHPGGKLGAELSRVGELMHRNGAVPVVQAETAMSDTLIEISQKGFGVAGVVDGDGALIGIITDGDLRRHMGDALLSHHAQEVMTADPQTISPSTLASEAVRLMNERKITCLFVTEDGRKDPIGLIHIHDCLRIGLG